MSAEPKMDTMTNAIVIDHGYDDIYELDNPMPRWMKVIMYGTVVYSIWYVFYYHFGPGVSVAAQYVAERNEYEAQRTEREKREGASISEMVLADGMQQDAVTSRGAVLFHDKCVACHSQNGEGLIGPNLTDNFQIHGSTRHDIYNTVRGGITGTAMIAWGAQLSPDDVKAVTCYAASLRGKKIPGKAAEGTPVDAFPAMD
jgi:cytochrome c oxidase cbb3-type subunit III